MVVVLDFQPVLRAVGGPVFRLSSERGGRYLGTSPSKSYKSVWGWLLLNKFNTAIAGSLELVAGVFSCRAQGRSWRGQISGCLTPCRASLCEVPAPQHCPFCPSVCLEGSPALLASIFWMSGCLGVPQLHICAWLCKNPSCARGRFQRFIVIGELSSWVSLDCQRFLHHAGAGGRR